MTTWTVLGAGAIVPRRGHGCAGHALETELAPGFTLFDCGPGTLRAAAEAGFALEDLARVVLSHEHPDHVLDLLALAFARRNPSLRGRLAHRLELVGPVGLAAFLERAAALFGERGWTRFEDVDVVEVDPHAPPGTALDRPGMRISWRANGHTPTAVSWRVDCASSAASDSARSIAYSGDTGENPAVSALARGVDLFVCECSFDDDAAVEGHLTPSSAGRLARAAQARRLALVHFYPGLDPARAAERAAESFGRPVELARDGTRFVVEGSRGERLG